MAQENMGVVLGPADERSERSERRESAGQAAGRAANPEVAEVARHRQFTTEYKMKILEEIDKSREAGLTGIILRREGLYSSTLTNWRQWRERMNKSGLRKSSKNEPIKTIRNENARLQRENQRLKLKLRKAEGLIELQKKISEILNLQENDVKEMN